MNGTRTGMGWGARLLIGIVLIIAGAAAATWGLARFQPAARVLGVLPPQPSFVAARPSTDISSANSADEDAKSAADDQKLSILESRLARVESATAKAQGSAGRADALVVAFAARRAIDRGVALGYLEPLLIDRFGARHQRAVATIISNSRQPVRLDQLLAAYDALGPDLRRGGPQDSWWTNFRRELGGLVQVHRADEPASSPDVRFERARLRLAAGDVDQALSETMRMPGASRASAWVEKARRYIAVHRALDEIESGALLPSPAPAPSPTPAPTPAI